MKDAGGEEGEEATVMLIKEGVISSNTRFRMRDVTPAARSNPLSPSSLKLERVSSLFALTRSSRDKREQ